VQPQPRIINIDWLEVFAFEPGGGQPCDANYFRSQGFVVDEREYGTRVYNQMFTILQDGHPWIEVRRSPKNPLMPYLACHLRLHNSTCYHRHAAQEMTDFMQAHGYMFVRISRIDICLDIVRFDDNTLPRVFMQRYMRGKFSKINQANIHSHGSDHWTGRVWNSVSWGSPTSMIGTKFYNKTLELYDPKTDSYGKPYIRYAWLEAGIIDDFNRCTLHGVQQEVWRIEFSIRSSVKRWAVIEINGERKKYQSLHNTIDCYDSPDKLLCIFASLTRHYFRFKKYKPDISKYDCPDRVLFTWSGLQQIVQVERDDLVAETTPMPELLRLIARLRSYRDSFATGKILDIITQLLRLLEDLQTRQELHRPWEREQILAFQQLLSRRVAGDQAATYDAILDEVKKLLSINDRTIIF